MTIILAFPESKGYGVPPESYIGPFPSQEAADAWIDEHEGMMRKYVCQTVDLDDPEQYVDEVRAELAQISAAHKER